MREVVLRLFDVRRYTWNMILGIGFDGLRKNEYWTCEGGKPEDGAFFLSSSCST